MWSPLSLCYDPIISKVFSRNRFESLLSFLHIVNEATEKCLKDEGDKLVKVRPLNDHLQTKCKERSKNGLGYDVVLGLTEGYLSQGYSLYIDNFYTSPTLVYDLYQKGVQGILKIKSYLWGWCIC